MTKETTIEKTQLATDRIRSLHAGWEMRPLGVLLLHRSKIGVILELNALISSVGATRNI
jgi:hypothetical protein